MIWTHTHEINWFCGEFLAYPQPSISTSFGPTRGYGNSFDLDTGDGWILDFQPLSRIEQDGKFHEQNYETSSRSAWDFYESLKMNGPFTRWVESWIASSQVLHDKRRTVPHPGLALGLASVPGGLRSMRMNEEPSIQDTVTGHGTMSHNAKPHIYECETRPNSNRQMQALFGRWSAGHLWIVAMMRPIYLWGASSLYEDSWAMSHHSSHENFSWTYSCLQPNQGAQTKTKNVSFSWPVSQPFPILSLNRTASRQKGFIKDDIIHRHCPLSIPVPQ